MMRKLAFLLLMIAVLALPGLIFAEEGQGVAWTGREWDGNIEAGNNNIVSIGREPARVDSIPMLIWKAPSPGRRNTRKSYVCRWGIRRIPYKKRTSQVICLGRSLFEGA